MPANQGHASPGARVAYHEGVPGSSLERIGFKFNNKTVLRALIYAFTQ